MTPREYLSRVHELDCVLCGASPVSAHHIRTGHGMAQKASDFLTVALCPECHQGPTGIHGDRTLLRVYKVTELDLLARTIAGVHKLRDRT